jgi:pimeloyl-ACP methyl ester carboxylesterase
MGRPDLIPSWAKGARVAEKMITRTDWFVPSDPGIEVFVRELVWTNHDTRVPLLLVHGGGGGGTASFDLPVPGFSLAEDLARAGHPIYLMDVRGWGRSTWPEAMAAPTEANPPAVRSPEVVRDIAAVVDAVRARRATDRIALLGWATGGHWAAMYAASYPDRVSHLISLNSLYGVDAPWSLRAAFEDAAHPGVFDPFAGAYAYRTEASLIGAWERSIPVADRASWSDPRVMAAYAAAILESDPTSDTRQPPSVRSPRGFQLDSYQMSRGHRFWDATEILAPALIIRGERDFWSRPEDLDALTAELTNASRVRAVTIPDGTHFLFNDRPERGRQQFLDGVIDWLR